MVRKVIHHGGRGPHLVAPHKDAPVCMKKGRGDLKGQAGEELSGI